MTKTVLNTKISEIESKTLNASSLATTTVFNTKLMNSSPNKSANHNKYITSPEFNKLTAESFGARLK